MTAMVILLLRCFIFNSVFKDFDEQILKNKNKIIRLTSPFFRLFLQNCHEVNASGKKTQKNGLGEGTLKLMFGGLLLRIMTRDLSQCHFHV